MNRQLYEETTQSPEKRDARISRKKVEREDKRMGMKRKKDGGEKGEGKKLLGREGRKKKEREKKKKEGEEANLLVPVSVCTDDQ